MTVQLTDRRALAHFRSRAVQTGHADFLHRTAADEIQERLIEVNRSFTSHAIITGFPVFWRNDFPNATIVPDEATLNLPRSAYDLVIHAMGLHWADDPVGQLVQSRLALKPDGLFLGCLLGGQTLHELRAVLAQAEADVLGGLSPRVAPMAEIRDLGALVQRAGFALPVADSIPLNVTYRDLWHLMHDLRAMGEGNALVERHRRPTSPALFRRAAEVYAAHFGRPDGRISATFELIFLTGWAPDETQPKPLRPGSAVTRLADALGTTEHDPRKD